MPAAPDAMPQAAWVAPPRAAPGRPDWASDGADWPNRDASRFVRAGGLRWHVQIAGAGPILLLLHGTGAATHSWRDLLPRLATGYTVVAPDLPGHGFTERPGAEGMSLPGMARGVAALLGVLGVAPDYAAGHSAGAAVLARLCLDGAISPKLLVGLNAALVPFGGPAHSIIAPFARLIARNPLMAVLFSWRAADRQVVEKLLAGTGSTIDADGVKFYARLARRSVHTGAALAMMGNWDLASLAAALPKLHPGLLLVVGENDRSIPPADAAQLAALMPRVKIVRLPGLGHLAHEERPDEVAAILKENCR